MGKVILAVIITSVAWIVGVMIGAPVNIGGDLGNLFAIITMGSFILYSIEKKNK